MQIEPNDVYGTHNVLNEAKASNRVRVRFNYMFVLMYWSWMREINIIECGQRMENELEWLASKYVDTFTIGIQSKKIKNKWAKLLCAIQNMVKKQQDLKFSFFSIANRMKEDKLRYENLNCFVLLPFFHFVGKLMISLEEMWWNREKNEEGKLRAFVLSIRPFKKMMRFYIHQ